MSNRTDYFGWLLRPVNSKSKVFAVLNCTGYFDESGTDANSRVIVVGGYASPKQDWRRLEIKWLKILADAKPKRVPYYHTTDLEAQPPRGIYKGWTRKEADILTDRLIPLIRDHVRWGLSVYVTTDDWFSVFKPIEKYFKNRPHKAQYVLLCKACIEGLVSSLDEKLPRQEQIAFVFDRNKWGGQIVESYNKLAANLEYGQRLGSIVFEDKKAFPGLQAADMFVWHYRRMTEQTRGYRSGPVHRIMAKAIRPDFTLRFVTKAVLKDLWDQFLELRRFPF